MEFIFILCYSETAFFSEYAIPDKKNPTTSISVPLLHISVKINDHILHFGALPGLWAFLNELI